MKTDNAQTWLLAWNPNNWNWPDYDSAINYVADGNLYTIQWSTHSTKLEIGDRFYLIVLGMDSLNGIIGSGCITSPIFTAPHWDPERAAQGDKVRRVKVAFETLLDYRKEIKLPMEQLNAMFPLQTWSTQTSGISINQDYLPELKTKWTQITEHLCANKIQHCPACGRPQFAQYNFCCYCGHGITDIAENNNKK